MEVLNICLSDIDKSKIFTAKNGKKYLSVVVTDRKEIDQYGNDLVVYVSQSKDERDSRAQKKLHRERQDIRRKADTGTTAGSTTATTAGRRNGRFTILKRQGDNKYEKNRTF